MKQPRHERSDIARLARSRGKPTLATTHPHLVAEWHPSNWLKPTDVVAGSNQSASWICSIDKEHVWDARIQSRTQGRGCPYCAGKQVDATNSLATSYPHLIGEWHPSNVLKPTEVTPASNRKVQWLCEAGHVWTTSVYHRTHSKSGCPVCYKAGLPEASRISHTRHKPKLAVTHPHLVAEWHPSNMLTPADVVAGSHLKVQWQCVTGHTWKAAVRERTRIDGATGCPECAKSNHSAIARMARSKGKPSLAITHPALAKQWHPDNVLSPSEVVSLSNANALWICDADSTHIWRSRVAKRVMGRGCPVCAAVDRAESCRRTTSEFIDLSRIIHDNRYDYSMTVYETVLTPVKIGCPVHGVFSQRPTNHLQGYRCQKCANERITRPELTREQQKRFDQLKETFSRDLTDMVDGDC